MTGRDMGYLGSIMAVLVAGIIGFVVLVNSEDNRVESGWDWISCRNANNEITALGYSLVDRPQVWYDWRGGHQLAPGSECVRTNLPPSEIMSAVEEGAMVIK